MLKIIKSISELNDRQFLAVFAESIRKNGQDFYGHLSENQQVKRAEEDLLSFLRDDFFHQKNAFCAAWIVDGEYKSVLRMEPYRDGLLLYGLETAPDARKMGYAFSLITEVTTYLRQSKYETVYSHISKRNFPSLGLHKKCGFQIISDSAVYVDGTVTQNSYTMLLKL